MVLPLARLEPRGEIAQLAIIAVIGEPHLGADEQYLAVVHDHAAVVYYVLVHYRPAPPIPNQSAGQSGKKDVHPDIAENAKRLVGGEYVRQHLPRVQHRVALVLHMIMKKAKSAMARRQLTLEKMVQTPISRNFELGPNAHGRATRFGDDDALEDAFHVSLCRTT